MQDGSGPGGRAEPGSTTNDTGSAATVTCAADAARAAGLGSRRTAPGARAAAPAPTPARRRPAGVVFAAVVLGTVGACSGVTWARPVYRSIALVEVAPTVPKIMYETPGRDVSPIYDRYIAAQAALASSGHVVDMAMASPAWTARRRPQGADAATLGAAGVVLGFGGAWIVSRVPPRRAA